jgi:hypothetical protein
VTWRQRARKWHRWLGLFAAAFVLILSVTGVLLNHTHRFKLDQTHIRADWLLKLYGISAPSEIPGFAVGEHWLSAFGGTLYHNAQELLPFEGPLLAAGDWGELAFAISADQLVLLTPQGEVIESMDSDLPAGIRQAGISGDLLVVGSDIAHSAINQDFSGWESVEIVPTWISSNALPADLVEALRQQFVGPGITVERIVQDIHSGRILGGLGVFLMDLAALALIFLALSGIYLFRRRKA